MDKLRPLKWGMTLDPGRTQFVVFCYTREHDARSLARQAPGGRPAVLVSMCPGCLDQRRAGAQVGGAQQVFVE